MVGMRASSYVEIYEYNDAKVNVLLSNYSDLLINENSQYGNQFSTPIMTLVNDRKGFYNEFLEIGLHIAFNGIESSFVPLSELSIEKWGETYRFESIEKVILHGKSIITSPEDYPLVQSAKWAIEHSDDKFVMQRLEDYLGNMTDSVNDSLHEDIKIELILKHHMIVEEKNGVLSLLEDEYDDMSVENTIGTDVVIWKDGMPIRVKPDFMQFPDYIFFHTPIEELGRKLLTDYSEITENVADQKSVLSFSHSNTATYANTYSSITTSTCSNGITLQNAGAYNSSYNYYDCVDCANFVSQAIKYGGYATDGIWYPYSTSWINSKNLENYLVTSGKVVFAGSLSSLQPGDVAWTGDLGHVVVYSAINPSRYTGHTNDRLRKNWDSSLTKYGLLY